jgi:hypothetical protein
MQRQYVRYAIPAEEVRQRVLSWIGHARQGVAVRSPTIR